MGIDPSLINPKFYDLDSDGIVYDMGANEKEDKQPTKKYLTLVTMESTKSLVPEECKKDEESMKYISSLAMNVTMTFNQIQKEAIKNISLDSTELEILQSLALEFDQSKYCFRLVFRNNTYFVHLQVAKQLQECKQLYENTDGEEQKELDKMTDIYRKDLETKLSEENIKKNEDQLEIWRNKYKSQIELFICVEDAENNEELEEQLLTRLEPVAPLLFRPDSENIIEKVKSTFK